ncbi:MAG: RnfABCDGE type electron transport complex subunit B [Deltaproteobacteria bacterium]|nr:RnfABCDGE type electron transport complex subunit B [Deltaproteobacteria bacterium]
MSSAFFISVLAMGGLGIAFAATLAIANKKLKVKEDPRIKKILEALPMTNCGACGVAGCAALAELLAGGKADITACTAGGQEIADAVAEALGVESVETSRVLAVVLCRGGHAEAKVGAKYKGDMSCAAADLTGGEKLCAYSCLGYADCVDECEFDAMDMSPNGLPVIFYDKCVGCGACAKACPRDIIEMHPEEHKLFVYCKNRDKGAEAKKGCSVACIACTLCVKDCVSEDGIKMQDNLAVIDYEACEQDDSSIKRCPTKCILFDEEESVTREAYYSSLPGKAIGD